jgi:hypothetical protein
VTLAERHIIERLEFWRNGKLSSGTTSSSSGVSTSSSGLVGADEPQGVADHAGQGTPQTRERETLGEIRAKTGQD